VELVHVSLICIGQSYLGCVVCIFFYLKIILNFVINKNELIIIYKKKDNTAKLGETCPLPPCDTTLSLTCQNNICDCPTGYYWYDTNCGNLEKNLKFSLFLALENN
jgi:hypothetical protein